MWLFLNINILKLFIDVLLKLKFIEPYRAYKLKFIEPYRDYK